MGHTERALEALGRMRGQGTQYEINELNELTPPTAAGADQRPPFAMTPRQTAEALDAWLRVGAPMAPPADPVAAGVALLALRRKWRRGADRRR